MKNTLFYYSNLVAFNHVAVQSYLVRCRALFLSFVLNLVLECSLILTAAEQQYLKNKNFNEITQKN